MLKNILLAGLVFLCSFGQCFGEIMLTTLNPTYSQDFNSYSGTLATLPTSWTATGSPAPTFRGVGNASSNAGGFYAFGSGGDFSLGVIRSGTGNTFLMGTSFQNNTGGTITDLTISFRYEQYRFANASGLNLTATGALAGNALIDAADFVGSSSGTNGTVANAPTTSLVLTGLSISQGSSFGFSWATTDASGGDNGLAIDNFTLTGTAVALPEPTSMVLVGLVGVAGVAVRARRRLAKKALLN